MAPSVRSGGPGIRAADSTDLPAVNAVVESAVATWDLPDRVKRLALPLYRYTEADLSHIDLRVFEHQSELVAVAAWDCADPRDSPVAGSALLLHGLYVSPLHHQKGVATLLLENGVRSARAAGLAGVVVRAQAGAEGFFQARGFERLPVRDEARDYAARFWRPLS